MIRNRDGQIVELNVASDELTLQRISRISINCATKLLVHLILAVVQGSVAEFGADDNVDSVNFTV